MSGMLNSTFIMAEMKSNINTSKMEIEELKSQILQRDVLEMNLYGKIDKLERCAELFDKERLNFKEALVNSERNAFEKDECLREFKGKNSELVKNLQLMKHELLKQESEIVLLNKKLNYRIEEVEGFKERLHTIIRHKYSECELLKEKLDILEVSYSIKQSEFIHLFNMNLKLKDQLGNVQLKVSHSDYMLEPYNSKSLFQEFNSNNQILIDKVKNLEENLNEKVHSEQELLENNKKLVEEIKLLQSKLKKMLKFNKLTSRSSLIDILHKLKKNRSPNEEQPEDAMLISKASNNANNTFLTVASINELNNDSKSKHAVDSFTNMEEKASNASATSSCSNNEVKKYINSETVTSPAQILLDKVKGDSSDHVFEIVLNKKVFTSDNNNSGKGTPIENLSSTQVTTGQQKNIKLEIVTQCESTEKEIDKNNEKIIENKKIMEKITNSRNLINMLEQTLTNQASSHIPPPPKLPTGTINKIREKSIQNETSLKTINHKSSIDNTPIAPISELQKILNQKMVFRRVTDVTQDHIVEDNPLNLIQNSLNKANNTLKKIEERNKARLNI